MRAIRAQLRFLAVVVLLISAALLLHARSRGEVVLPHRPLSAFPHQLGEWIGTDVNMPNDILQILGPGDFLLRTYQADSEGQPPVDLFIAYFPSQRAGDTIHSPKHCLPGAGWEPVEASRTTLSFPGRPPFPANRYLIAKGDDRQLALYWYQAHDRSLASEYSAKFYLVADAIRMNRSDGSLIRLTTPILRGESLEAAQQRVLSLATLIMPGIDDYIPR